MKAESIRDNRWLAVLRRSARGLAPVGGFLVLLPLLAVLSFGASGDSNADFVLGQGIFTANGPNLVNASSLDFPAGVAIDGAGHVYVADQFNNRVLAWKSATSLSNGQFADLVIGQPDFFSLAANQGGGSSTTASTLSAPVSVATDGVGNLYVADSGNNRVLEYNTPFDACSTFPCVGGAAKLVFGQGGNFLNHACNLIAVGPGSLCMPFGVGLDPAGDLYVADTGNNRVLEYDAPLQSSPPNITADVVFGQGGSFTKDSCNDVGDGDQNLCAPMGVGLDTAGNLYVADTNNNRVLEYNAPLQSSPPNTTADVVFGQQGDFDTTLCNLESLSDDSLCGPTSVALGTSDGTDLLYVADQDKQPSVGIQPTARTQHHRRCGLRPERQLHYCRLQRRHRIGRY